MHIVLNKYIYFLIVNCISVVSDIKYHSEVWVSKFLNSSERRLLFSPKLYLFDQKYSKNSNIVKYYLQFSIIQSLMVQPQIRTSWDSMENANKKRK